jgi:hypothetical protein
MIVMALGNVWRLRPRDAHHDPQDHHPPRRQSQPTPRTDHLLDQLAPFRRVLAWHWGAADCMQVRQLNAGLVANTNDG